MKKVIFHLCTIMVLFVAAQEQEEKSKTTFGGSADIFYKINNNGGQDVDYTSFVSKANSFELGMVSFTVSHDFGKGHATFDIGMGDRAEAFTGSEDSKMIIKQLYLTYDLSDKWSVTGGTWGTHVGYELADAFENSNYSMSYLFSYGPFYHTGAKIEYATGGFNAMVGLTDPTDLKSGIGFDNKFLIAQLGYSTDDSSIYLNYNGGSYNPENVNISQLDLTGAHQFSDAFGVGLNTSYKTFSTDDISDKSSWWGAALYFNYDLSKKIKLTYRTEYFDDSDGVGPFIGDFDGIGASVFTNTLTLNYAINNLTIKPEIRFEKASREVFVKDDIPTDVGGYFILGTTYSF